MHRREFIKASASAAVGFKTGWPTASSGTKHLVWIINGGGSRQQDWYGRPDEYPNFARMARQGFTFTNDWNDTVANHQQCWTELITGNPACGVARQYPTLMHYVRLEHGDAASRYFYLNGVDRYRQLSLGDHHLTSHSEYGEHTRPVLLTMTAGRNQPLNTMGLTPAERKRLGEFLEAEVTGCARQPGLKNGIVPREPMLSEAAALGMVPSLLQAFKPRMVIVQMAGHDVAHESYADYEQVCRTTDELLGRIIDFIQGDPYFSKNTAIIVRPEVGRDDYVNACGELNHSIGFDQCHRSASIFWGPGFRRGQCDKAVNRMDMVPTLAHIFGVKAPCARGRVRHELFTSSEFSSQI
jgi:hypothetical protein